MRVLASKKSKFEAALKQAHPAIARLAREVANRQSSRTSMTDLAIRIASILHKKTNGEHKPEDTVRMERDAIIQIADWAAATGNEWKNMRTFEEMKESAKEWHDELAKKSDRNATYVTEDKTVMEFPDGWRIVELDPRNCKAEGEIMGHCVGGYAQYIRDGSDVIFSLRDPRNRPHVTFNATDRGDEDAEYWNEDGEWEYSRERAEEQREEDWHKLISPEARRLAAENAATELRRSGPSLFDPEDLEVLLPALIANNIKAMRQEYEELWGEVKEIEVYDSSKSKTIGDPYGDEIQLESWAQTDYNERYEQYEPPSEDGDWRIEQVQGKEDRPPLDKYRPYLNAFLETKDYPTDEVQWRLKPVKEMLQELPEHPGLAGSFINALREVDREPIYDYLFDQILSSSKTHNENLLQLALGYIEKRLNFGSATPKQMAVIEKLMQNRDAIPLLQSGVLNNIPGGIQWALNLALAHEDFKNIEDTDRFLQLAGQLYDMGVFMDAGQNAAMRRKLEILNEQKALGKASATNSLPSLYQRLLSEDEALEKAETIIGMTPESSVLGSPSKALLARIYQQDPERWRQILKNMPEMALRNLMMQPQQGPNILTPTTELISDTQYDLFDYTDRIPRRYDWDKPYRQKGEELATQIYKDRLYGKPRAEQYELPLSASTRSSLIRLASIAEEISPYLADRIESLI